MPDYSKGKIYKIEPIIEHEEGYIYYGATVQSLSERMRKHNVSQLCSCNIIFKKYGFDNCKISLIELCNFKTKEELNIRETYYIQNNKCVNKVIPFRSEEYKKDYRVQRYKKNKEHYNNKNKEWSDNNKERHKELNKLNYLKNREDILLKAKIRYELKKNNL